MVILRILPSEFRRYRPYAAPSNVTSTVDRKSGSLLIKYILVLLVGTPEIVTIPSKEGVVAPVELLLTYTASSPGLLIVRLLKAESILNVAALYI